MDDITPYSGPESAEMTRQQAKELIMECYGLLCSCERLIDKCIETLDRTELRLVE